jgi:hypothetical protein
MGASVRIVNEKRVVMDSWSQQLITTEMKAEKSERCYSGVLIAVEIGVCDLNANACA